MTTYIVSEKNDRYIDNGLNFSGNSKEEVISKMAKAFKVNENDLIAYTVEEAEKIWNS